MRYRGRNPARRAGRGINRLMLLGGALCAISASAFGEDQAAPPPTKRVWRPIAKIAPELMAETSGIVASRKYPGIYWAHADSGNDPKLLAIDAGGNRVAEVMLAQAPNIDWEDICSDDAGHLYVGDIGNNTGLLPVRYIYQVDEPDPYHPPAAPVVPTTRWQVRYADSPRVNLETLLWRNGTLYVVERSASATSEFYALVPAGGDVLELRRITSLDIGMVSGGDISPDGATLLVCSPYAARLYALDADAKPDQAARRAITFPKKGNVEACCFADNEVVFAAENGNVFRATLRDFDEQVAFRVK